MKSFRLIDNNLTDKEKLYYFNIFLYHKEVNIILSNKLERIIMKNKSTLGEDSLKLFFKITKKADLFVKCFGIKDEFLGEYNLGNIF